MRAGRVLRQIVIARIADQVPSLTAVIDGRVYEVKEDPRPSEDRGFLEALAEGYGNI